MNATWQRCRVHTMRNALAHAGKSSRRVVSAFIATAFAQDSAAAAKAQWRKVADQLRLKLPKLSTFMDEAEDDVLAYMSFPVDHWPKIHSTTASNGSTARSSGAPRSSASSPTTKPSSGSSERSCWSRTTNGPFSAVAT
jgi:transposase-like protein